MASLNSLVRTSVDVLKDRSSWVVFWKEGRSWNAKQVTIGDNLNVPTCELDFLNKIHALDESAVILNLEYSIGKDAMRDLSFSWLHETIKRCYECGNSTLRGFLEMLRSKQDVELEESRSVTEDKQIQAQPEMQTSSTVASVKEPRPGSRFIVNQRIEDISGDVSIDVRPVKHGAKADNCSPTKDCALDASAPSEGLRFKRGSVWLMELVKTSGSVQYGKRPVVIIQNNILNTHSPTVLIAPLTSKDRRFSKSHVPVDAVWLKLPSLVLLEQVKAVDKMCLSKYIGTFDNETMERIDKAVHWCLFT